MGLKIDARAVNKMFDRMQDIPVKAMAASGKYFKSITPINEGNARRNTSTDNLTIRADYGYAGRLDEGWSKQAPKGMSDPTIDYLDKQIEQEIKRL